MLQGPIKAFFFDMDSTVIAEETLPLLAKSVGLEQKVAEITERAMAGELDFKQALQQRVALLKGVPLSAVADLAQKVTLNPGVEDFALAAEKASVSCYLVSGGFYPLIGILVGRLRFAGSVGNFFEVDRDGKLTGKIAGAIVDAAAKRNFVERICNERQLHKNEIIAVGDGANDIPMMQLAGLAVGFNPKDVLKPHVKLQISDHRELIQYVV